MISARGSLKFIVGRSFLNFCTPCSFFQWYVCLLSALFLDLYMPFAFIFNSLGTLLYKVMNHEYKNNNFLDICSCVFLKSMLLIKNWCGMVQATLKIGGNFSHLNGFHARYTSKMFLKIPL